MMRNSKNIMKNARRKLAIPMLAAILCKLQRNYRETWCVDECKTKYADEFMRKRMEGPLHKNHEDHNSPCSQIHSYASSNTRCKGSSGEIMGTSRENTGMSADESPKQKWGDRWSKEWRQNRALRIVNGRMSSQEFGVGTTVSKIQRSSCAPRWQCERRFRIVCSLHWTGSSAPQMTAAKVMLGRNKTLTQSGKYWWKTLIWEHQHHSLTTSIWVAIEKNAKRAKIFLEISEPCLNPKSLLEL